MNMAEKFGESFMEIILHPNRGSPYDRTSRHPTVRTYCVDRYGSSSSLKNDDWKNVVEFIYQSNFHFDDEGADEIHDSSNMDIDELVGRIQNMTVHYNSARKSTYTFRGRRIGYKNGFAKWTSNGISYRMNIGLSSLLKLAMGNDFTFVNDDSNGAIIYGGDLKHFILDGEVSEVDKAVREIYNAMRNAQMDFNEKNTEEVAIQLLKDSGVVKELVHRVLY